MKIFFLFLSLSLPMFAASVRLYNDSPYILRAVVQGSDGSYLGEVVIQPNQLMIWNDANGQLGYHEPSRSETPFTILWYCTEGAPYSVCSLVGNAFMVTAQSCAGNRQCKTPPPPALPAPGQQPEVQFYQQQPPTPETFIPAPPPP